ncbi:MAG TPA: alpha/beta fold hydrolase, partial [Paenibacillus sp.]|nr:alpha/beta fold hydrolase [Paenibacillus sp.]
DRKVKCLRCSSSFAYIILELLLAKGELRRKVKHTVFYFEGYEKTKLRGQSWVPDRPKAIVAVIHGVGSHSGGISNLTEPLTEAGYAVFSYDLRGHGRSEGQRGLIRSFVEYREDTCLFMRHVVGCGEPLPVFLVGHSLGGVVALDYTVFVQPDFLESIVLICPALMPNRIQTYLNSIDSATADDASYEGKPDFEMLTSDLHVIDRFQADPLRHHAKTAGLHRGTLRTLKALFDDPARLHIPLLLLQGGRDEIVPPSEPRAYYDALPDAHGKHRYILYPDMKHNPHDEVGRERAIGDILAWIQSFH